MENNVFSRLILFRDNIYNVNWTSAVFFHVSSLFNTNKIMYFFFVLPIAFHGRGIPCQSPTVVGKHSTVSFSLVSLLHWRNVLIKTFSMFITHCTTVLWEKIQMRVKEVYFFLTCCSLNSGSSAKDCLQVPHSFEPFCFPKILLLQI